jgi:hypothetical protein
MGLPSCLFPSNFSTRTLYALLPSPTRATCPTQLILPNFDHPNNVWWGVQITKYLVMQSSPVICLFMNVTTTHYLFMNMTTANYLFMDKATIYLFVWAGAVSI